MLGQLIKVHLRVFLTVEVHSIARLVAVESSNSTATLDQFGLRSLLCLGLQLLIKFLESLEPLIHLDIGCGCRVLHVLHHVLARRESTEILLVVHVATTTRLRVFSGDGK